MLNPDHIHEYCLPRSLFDTDLYKLTMQQAVLKHFPNAEAVYRFTHRDENVYFTRECYEKFRIAIQHFSELKATDAELSWLKNTYPYFKSDYIEYLSSFRFKPEQVEVDFEEHGTNPSLGRLQITATGPWKEAILWEVPLMACLSEKYFRTVDTDWNYDGQEEAAYRKAVELLEADIQFSEFGTRRRRSYEIQDLVIKTLVRASHDVKGRGKVVGTSNVHLAMKHNITPIGTIAHEWFMGVAAANGYEHATALALDLWTSVYPEGPLLCLTDTFSTEIFYKDFVTDRERALKWTGLRQDSGDPYVFAPRAKEIYQSMGIDHREKMIIYSDALDNEKALRLKKQCDEIGFKVSFGIGTSLTNDFYSVSSGEKKKSKALNMVIKLASLDGEPCVKISDELTKNSGDPETVRKVKQLYGLPL